MIWVQVLLALTLAVAHPRSQGPWLAEFAVLDPCQLSVLSKPALETLRDEVTGLFDNPEVVKAFGAWLAMEAFENEGETLIARGRIGGGKLVRFLVGPLARDLSGLQMAALFDAMAAGLGRLTEGKWVAAPRLTTDGSALYCGIADFVLWIRDDGSVYRARSKSFRSSLKRYTPDIEDFFPLNP